MSHPAYVDTQNFGLDDLFFADELTMTRPFPAHRHSFAELHYIRGGAGTEVINGVSYPLRPGSISLKMPWHIHELRPAGDRPLQISKCSFRMNTLEEGGLLQSVSTALARGYDACPMADVPQAERPGVEQAFSGLMEEQRHARALKEEQTAALMLQLLICFLRNRPQTVEQAGCTAHDILRLMNLRYREPELTCAQIAQAVHYSEGQVSRMLVQQYGLSFGELLREIRVRNACTVLKTTTSPVESVARWAGYSSRDGFYSAFMAEQGMTPAEYRERYGASSGGKTAKVLSSAQMYAKLIYYLHRHYAEPVTAAQAAEYFSISERYLARVLKEQGTTFAKLLEEIRIYHARQLLQHGDYTPAAVAQAAGFASPETFYRAFRRQMGTTPMEYRRTQADGKKTDKKGTM